MVLNISFQKNNETIFLYNHFTQFTSKFSVEEFTIFLNQNYLPLLGFEQEKIRINTLYKKIKDPSYFVPHFSPITVKKLLTKALHNSFVIYKNGLLNLVKTADQHELYTLSFYDENFDFYNFNFEFTKRGQILFEETLYNSFDDFFATI